MDLAEDLARNKKDEAKLRASISRAYYAAFCNARNYMFDHDGNEFPRDMGMGEHQYLVQYYKGDAEESKTDDLDGTRFDLGKDLDSMRIMRKRVDYHDRVDKIESLEKKTDEVLKRSRRVISKIERGGF
ncbi:MAG: hypothetical protein JW999_00580 [Methanotrichaceae archaeon]|nr:hypothetical protein [Methanotrichaceae archaeon]